MSPQTSEPSRRRGPASLHPFPDGWYVISLGAHLGTEKLLQKTWMGQEIVAWRGGRGAVCVADGFCPHLGSLLGPETGGVIRNGNLVCPFHSFQFDVTGRCRATARQVGLLRPRAWPDLGELASWEEIAPALRRRLQGIPAPTERAPAHFDDWHRRRCGVGYGSRGEGAGSRYLKVTCQHPGCGYQVRLTRKWLAPFGSDHGHRPGPTLPAAGHCLRIPTEAIAY